MLITFISFDNNNNIKIVIIFSFFLVFITFYFRIKKSNFYILNVFK